MMEKAIKQRLLGGLVLVAGAALFLPVLLDGSGASLTIPPMPAAPEVAAVEDMAPRLDQKVEAADQEIDTAHAGRDALPPDTAASAAEIADAGADSDVAPDAAALAAAGSGATAPGAATPTSAPGAARPVPSAPVPAVKPVAPATVPVTKPVVQAPAVKPAAPVASAPAPAARPQAPVTAPALAPAAAKPAVTTTAPAPAKPAATATAKPDASAWVVQVASLSSREKAQTLMQQLRRKGYPAVLSQHGGNWKVMVGPELSREVATTMKNRLNADSELDVNGAWVQAYKP